MELTSLNKRQLVFYEKKHKLLFVDSVNLRTENVTCNNGNVVVNVHKLKSVDSEVLGLFGLTVSDIEKQGYTL